MTVSTKPLRFIAVGIANSVIDFAVLLGLTSLGVELVLANIISTTVALSFSFFVNRSFTFKSTGLKRREMFKFLAVTLIGLWVLQPIILVITFPLLNSILNREVGIISAKLIATLVSMVWNYLLYNSFVFKK